MKKIAIIGTCFLGIALFVYYRAHPLAPQLEIRGNKFTVELAITDKEREKGLGYRDALPANQGMLFVYDHPEQYNFWMKGMRFPIDIIWIQDKKIVDISPNVPIAIGENLSTYTPKIPVSQILEVNAGTVDRLGIQIGDAVKILKN